MAPHKVLENIGILCVERRFSRQNSVIRLKSNILAPPIFRLAMPLVGKFVDLVIFCYRYFLQ